MNRLLIAGTHSGCGKTTVTLALLLALKARKLSITSFKCGPDYIDPMFHEKALGLPAYNLDPFFLNGEKLLSMLAHYGGKELSLLEGAMGYYDGIACTERASAYELAKATDTPAVLVVNAKGVGNSIGATIKGFQEYRPGSGIAGVIFNNCSPGLYADFKEIAQTLHIRPLGFLPHDEGVMIKSRHLGLITAREIGDLWEKLARLCSLAQAHIDLEGVRALANAAPEIKARPLYEGLAHVPARVAVAKDEAFCFLYRESLDLLEALGAKLLYFSPLKDEKLPDGIGGLYLPGGYPELYLKELSGNTRLREEIRERVRSGLPTIAECGGFMYLHETIGRVPMAGVIKGNAYRTEKLQRFGYVSLLAARDNMLLSAGESAPAHEFHYYESEAPGNGLAAHKAGREHSWPCAHVLGTLYAGFPHLYFHAKPEMAKRFLERALEYAAQHHT